MLRKVIACLVTVCCLAMFAGCEPPKGSGEKGPAATAEQPAKKGSKKSMKKEVRKKKPPHVTTAK